MDPASFGLGLLTGVLLLVVVLVAFVVRKVRRFHAAFTLLDGLHAQGSTLPGPGVQTDEEGYIVPREEA